ncbi:hypothetical protein LJC00_03460 [Dysgonomonas sp. OttesenSCG-928-M03]|nr:hypothetical protein [Dysgonomonas sp. OttesenSCG-928-M03]
MLIHPYQRIITIIYTDIAFFVFTYFYIYHHSPIGIRLTLVRYEIT